MVHQGPTRNIYGVEGQFIEEMEGEMSSTKFIAHHPDEAHMFFLPFSISKMVDFLYTPLVSLKKLIKVTPLLLITEEKRERKCI